jgi:hypothetical protein
MMVAALLAAGCARRDGSHPAPDPAQASSTSVTNAAAATTPRPTGPATLVRYPVVTPVTLVQGRVISVNERLRFVIADFAFHRMPQPGQRLGVFREGRRIGEVRVSGPFDGAVLVADIMAGEAGVSDLLRAE